MRSIDEFKQTQNKTMKKVISTIGLCSALVVGFALVATAAEKEEGASGEGKRPGGGAKGGERPEPGAMFAKLDADGSGGVSLEEFKNNPRAKAAPDPSKVDERFKMLDGDGDGQVTQEEFTAAMKNRKGRPGAEGGKGKDKGAGGDGAKKGPKPTE
jgi:hypothetical protein